MSRKHIILHFVKGLAVYIAATLILMLIMAGAVVLFDMSDGLILALNQVIKVIAVALGTLACVGIGGKRGLFSGAALGTAYAIIGYCAYCVFGDGKFAIMSLLGEFLICIATGAVFGAVFTNLARNKTYYTQK